MEIKLKIEAVEIVNAINNLADAIRSSRMSAPAFTDEIDSTKGWKSPNGSPQKSKDEPPTKEEVEKTSSDTPIASSPAPSVPLASAPQYTIEQIMKAGAALMDEGKIEELRGLISSFGVEAVTNLKPEQLGAFATELRKLGAKI